jgi:hypothetical protein
MKMKTLLNCLLLVRRGTDNRGQKAQSDVYCAQKMFVQLPRRPCHVVS